MSEAEATCTRCGFIAVIGPPNAGKSTLVNRLVGSKVSIVSRKVQTTRLPLRGIVVAGNCQLVLIDTPGIFGPKKPLERAMVHAAWGEARDADGSVLILDGASALTEDGERILDALGSVRAPLVWPSTRSTACRRNVCWRWRARATSGCRLQPPS